MTHTTSTRTGTISRHTVSALIIIVLLLTSVVAYANPLELYQIRQAIKAKGGRWVADETSISKLTPTERKMRLGVDEKVGQEAAESSEPPAVPDTNAAALNPSLDWRSVNGLNYVTPIKNQGSCGSCWAFAVTAALESQVLIDAGSSLDLSEQILVSCSGAGTCSGGSPSSASTYIRTVGLPLETCFPYTATNNSCSSACLNWQSNTYKVIGWHSASTTVDAIKNALYTYGPVVTTFYVYNDFYYYKSGVYSYTSGSYVGAHAVLTIGYDDVNQCFIVKNSWGAGWGEAGFFRIAYSEVTGTSRFGYSVLAYDGYATTTCVQANPGVTLSPSSQSMTPGTPVTYTLSVTNNDNAGCASSTFNLTAAAPSGWTASFGSSALTIGPGATASTTLSAASPATAANGNYTITVTATDSASPTYKASASVTASIQAAACTQTNPTVTPSPSSQSMTAGTSVTYTLSVTNNDNSGCASSTFNLTAAAPSGWTASLGSSALTIGPGGSATTTLSVTSPATAVSGNYTITATATDSAAPTHKASGSVTASIQAATCTPAKPTVALSPTVSNWVKAGTAVPYTLSVTNNDNSVCTASAFTLSADIPDTWKASFGSSTLTISPGGSATATLSVTSPAGFADGTYTITAKGADSTYTASASATQTLVSSLTVGVSTDKSSYKSNQPVSIKATVSAKGSGVPNAIVTFSVTNGGTAVTTNVVTTDAYGNASFTWAQKSKANGTYSITANATFNGISGSNTATFKVQ